MGVKLPFSFFSAFGEMVNVGVHGLLSVNTIYQYHTEANEGSVPQKLGGALKEFSGSDGK
jgi:hypothetical protein